TWHGGATVALRIKNIDWGFIAGNKSAIGVRRRGDECAERVGMPQYAADIVASRIADQRVVLSVVEDVLAPLPQALVRVHARAVVLENRLRHDRYRFAVPAGNVLDDVFVDQDLIGHARERRKSHIDLGLSCRTDLVVVNLYPDSAFLQCAHHLRSEILQVIHGRDWEITLFVAWLVAEIWPVGLTCVPKSFLG